MSERGLVDMLSPSRKDTLKKRLNKIVILGEVRFTGAVLHRPVGFLQTSLVLSYYLS